MRPGRDEPGNGGRKRSPLCWLCLGALAGLLTGCHATRATKPLPPPTPNQVLYERARDLIESRKFEKAREVLAEIGTREAQSAELDPLVKIAVADAYFYEPGIANVIEAQSRYSQFLTFYPSSPLAGYAQFQIGMCYFKQSPMPHHDQTYTRRAIQEFEKVATMAPGSRFVRAAGEMRDRCLGKLARHDFQVAQFYFKRKAYSGAISRLQEMLDNYPRYQNVDEVYYYLGTSLLRSGSSDEGRIYLEKLMRDYPRSRFALRARDELGKNETQGVAGRDGSPPPPAPAS